jgi:hypothetical protein
MGLSRGFLKAEGWRAAGFSLLDDFALNFLLAAFLPADPNDLVCMARKWQDSDVSLRIPDHRGHGFHGMVGMISTRRWARFPRQGGRLR